MLEAADKGEVGVQYPGGFESRNGGIELRATRPAIDEVDDLRRSCAALEQRWPTMPSWDGRGLMTRFEVPIVDLRSSASAR